jgi:glycosyltransferase involved in cell wall biosynthesis
VVEPENTQQLARSIVELARDPERRTYLGQEGREYVTTHFNRKTLAHRYLEILTQLTDR